MKITKTKFAAATFGAALTSLYSAPELNAQLIDINFSPDTLEIYGGTYQVNSSPALINFTNVNFGSYPLLGIPNGAGVGAFNDSLGVLINNATGGFSQFALVEPGDFFTTGTTRAIEFDASETGIRYIGFVAGGSVGWFSIDLGDTPNDGSDLVFTGGQFLQGGTPPGEPFGITVGGAAPDPIKGDVNQDGTVDFFDIQPFIDVLSSGEFQAEADVNCDTVVDFFDIQAFIDILAGGSAGLAGLALGSTGLRRRRKAAADSHGQEVE